MEKDLLLAKRLLAVAFIVAHALFVFMCLFFIGKFVMYIYDEPENFFKDRGEYVKKELAETRHFSLREGIGEVSFKGVVPCLGNEAERTVFLVVTEKGTVVYSLDGTVLARTEDTQGNGVYCWKQQYYVLPCERASWGFLYSNKFAVRNEVLRSQRYDLMACEGTSEYQNYDVRQIDEKTLELTKTYEYVWQKDLHFTPIRGFKGFFDWM